jgi:flagellar M-ring protein FliF
VPAPLLYETRLKLASAGLPKGGNGGYEFIDNQKFGATQFQEQINYQRALEGELTRSIQSLAAVQSARVHLAIPKASIFMREQQKPTASVLLSIYPGKTLERAQVAGIMHLVSSSLPDLPMKNVAVVDQTGALLSPQADSGVNGQLDATQLSYVQQIEQTHIKRIMEILVPLYGENNVRAQVTADIDFNQSETTSHINKPNQGKDAAAAVSSQQISQSGSGTSGAAGVPGALSNQPPGNASAPIAGTPTNPAAGAAGGAANSQSRSDTITNYQVDTTVQHVKSSTGAVKRLSAAVVLNHKKAIGGKPGALPLPLAPEEITKVDALVKEAIGFSKERGDSINVVNAPFTPREIEVLPEPPIWKQADNVAMAKEFGKLALIGGIVLYILLGVLRPMLRQILAHRPPELTPEEVKKEEEETAAQESLALPSPLDNARALAKQDPKVVASVVRGWVNGNG